jgi:hypothetical protein
MREVKAYEHNGKLYRSAEEALKQELYGGLTTLFFPGDSWNDIARKIVHRKDIQNHLVSLITKHQEELNGD